MPDLSLLFRSHASFNSFVEIANRQNEGGHAIQIHVVWAKENFMSSTLDIDKICQSVTNHRSFILLNSWNGHHCVQNTITIERWPSFLLTAIQQNIFWDMYIYANLWALVCTKLDKKTNCFQYLSKAGFYAAYIKASLTTCYRISWAEAVNW